MPAFLMFIMLGVQFAYAQDNNKPATSDTEILRTILGSLNLESPEKDLNKNIRSGDLRFVCICGYACYTPGVENSDIDLTKKYGTRCLEGTSDMIENKEHGKLMQTAEQYAKRYNTSLLKKLKLKENP